MKNGANRMEEVLSDMELFDSPAVTAEMKRQWEAKTEPDSEMLSMGERIRGSLSKQISGHRFVPRALRRWRRYGVAASILLLITLGLGVGLISRPADAYYVYHSGNQDRIEVTLEDGTVVTLGARSKIVYPERFENEERRVEMEGQVYFEVAPDAKRPFVVETRSLDVTALGTAFEVFEDEEHSFTEVMLAEGKVRVDYPAKKGTGSYMLDPDMKLLHVTGERSVAVSLENAQRYSAWKDGYGLYFVKARVSDILPRLEKWFGCTIVCESPDLLDETFTFRVRTEPPEVIMENMKRTLPEFSHKYDPDSNTYTISAKQNNR